MKVYLYNPENGEFTREDEAVESPAEEGVYLIPAFATQIAPPQTKDNEVAGFSGETWTVRKRQTSPVRTPKTVRDAKLAEIKSTAARLLSVGDYQVQRHAEQLALSIPTSLTAEEYAGLLESRQAIRERSNSYEKELESIPDIADLLDALQIKY